MTTKQITASNADEKIKQLYETAFPEDEQIPWKDLMRLVEEMPLDFSAYYDGEDFIGFTIVYPRESINWFWYFAVCEKLRGKGYGQQMLTQMIEHYKGQSFVLDMESPRRSVRTLTNANAVKTSIFATALGTQMSIVPTTTSP